MDRDLYNGLVARTSLKNGVASNSQNVFTDIQCLYQVQEKKRKILEIELCKVKENKIAMPMDRLLNAIHSCHRIGKKCSSVMDTITNLTTKYEINYDKKSTVILSLVSSAVKNCPFCCKKQFKEEKPVLIRWSNGLLYKGYVLSKEGRLCYVELDNYNTAVLDCKDVFDEFEHEVMCTVCMSGSSEPPNEIVLCDYCNSGYHQKCHKPIISQDILCLDDDWFCARCELSKTSRVSEMGDVTDEPKYTLSTLACMALLCLGPSKRSAVHSWVQDIFNYYQKQKSDKWKTKLTTIMSTSGHWVFLERSSGLWQLQSHNTPSLVRHLNEVTKGSTDIPPHVIEKIRSEFKPTLDSLNLYYDYLPYDTSALTWDAKHRQNKEGLYCYCMGPGVWYKQMLQCLNCEQWFHQACVSCVPKPLLFGESNVFVCSVCNLGEEHLTLRALSDRDALHLAMYHVVMTRYHGDFQLPVCLRMNVVPLLQVWDQERYGDLQVWSLAQTAGSCPDLFEPGAKHRNTTLYRLLVDEPPSFTEEDGSPTAPLPASPQPIPNYLPPGFVMDLSNGTSGLQVDGSPPAEDFPPSRYNVSLFKDVDYYGKKRKVRKSQRGKQTKSGEKRKNSGSTPQKPTPQKPTVSKTRDSEAEGMWSQRSRDKRKHDAVQYGAFLKKDRDRKVRKRRESSRTNVASAAREQKPKRVARTTSTLQEDVPDKPRADPAPVATSLPMKRLQSGENYQILGKREGTDGGLEYLIAWEGVRSRCLQRIRM